MEEKYVADYGDNGADEFFGDDLEDEGEDGQASTTMADRWRTLS